VFAPAFALVLPAYVRRARTIRRCRTKVGEGRVFIGDAEPEAGRAELLGKDAPAKAVAGLRVDSGGPQGCGEALLMGRCPAAAGVGQDRPRSAGQDLHFARLGPGGLPQLVLTPGGALERRQGPVPYGPGPLLEAGDHGGDVETLGHAMPP